MILVRIHILFYPEFEKLVEYLRSGHLTKGDKSGKLVFITHTSVLWRWTKIGERAKQTCYRKL